MFHYCLYHSFLNRFAGVESFSFFWKNKTHLLSYFILFLFYSLSYMFILIYSLLNWIITYIFSIPKSSCPKETFQHNAAEGVVYFKYLHTLNKAFKCSFLGLLVNQFNLFTRKARSDRIQFVINIKPSYNIFIFLSYMHPLLAQMDVKLQMSLCYL